MYYYGDQVYDGQATHGPQGQHKSLEQTRESQTIASGETPLTDFIRLEYISREH